MVAEVGNFIIRARRDDAANWTSVNPIPALGEICLEMDSRRFKVGDGILDWNNLPYWNERPHITTISGTTHTLSPADENGVLLCTNPLGCLVTLPKYADVPLPNGFITHVHQDAAGQVVLVGAAGVTTKTAISLKTRVINSSLSIIVQAQNIYKIIGDAEYP